MKYCDRVIAVSSTTANDTNKILSINLERITVIPNAVEPIFQPLTQEQIESFRTQQRLNPDTICLLNVGSNHPRKNIKTILQVIQILKQQGLSIKFWKAGADFTVEQKKFIKDHQLQSEIEYLGKPDKSTLVKIYNSANALIAPSFHEGFGITLLEAMACGTPVITANVSAMPEVIGDAGILINPNNPQEIADEILLLCKDTLYYQTIREKSLKRAKFFTWEKTAEQVANVYEQLILGNH
jgi:glycosyltransferase involved in cell wall biosynthesis